MEYLTFSNLLRHGIFNLVTTRAWGPINGRAYPQESLERLSRLLREEVDFSAPISALRLAHQVHGRNTADCTTSDAQSSFPECDALATHDKELILCTYTADCIPLLVFDPIQRVVAAVHAGHRGLAAGVIESCISRLRQHYGSASENLLIALGPYMKRCCYEVRSDFEPILERHGWRKDIEHRGERWFLDLAAIAHRQLQQLGVQSANIEDCEICTGCSSDRFFSARNRKDGENPAAAFASLISLREWHISHQLPGVSPAR